MSWRSLGVTFQACLWLVVGLAVVFPSSTCPASDGVEDRPASLKDVFARGNELYEAGDYEGAIDRYVSLVDADVEDGDLFYNLANAYYKVDDLGRAVLFYERALRRLPRDRDVRENLELVRSQLKDRQFVREQNRFVRLVNWLHNNSSTKEMLILTSCCYVLVSLFGVGFIFRDSRPVKAVYKVVSVVSPGRLAGLSRAQDLLGVIVVAAFLLVTLGVSSYHKVKRDVRRVEAVVLEREIPVFASPTEDATLQFKIHEGTLVTVREQRRQCVRIGLPGGLSGWVSAPSLERI
ncbi:MAG: tetratricopeptide repeat protein [Candidatus Latescibacterota bacterium]|nr:MAG: tetratricopeptide repeat protein [Candidatus Latescibacterota bacterium]